MCVIGKGIGGKTKGTEEKATEFSELFHTVFQKYDSTLLHLE
jgi:hypothetical protein